MLNSNITKNHDGQNLFNAISVFSVLLESELYSVSVMRRKRRASQYLISSNMNSVMIILSAACIHFTKAVLAA